MFKKNKKEYKFCLKCGKPLSNREIIKGVSKCENCLGKQAKKTRGLLTKVGAGAVTGIIIFIATGGKKGKL